MKPRGTQILKISLGALGGLLVFTLALPSIFDLVYRGRIFPNVKIAGLPVSDLSKAEAGESLKNVLDDLSSQEIKIEFEKEYTTSWDELGIVFASAESINRAYEVGRGMNPLKTYPELWAIFVNNQGIRLIPEYTADDKTFAEYIYGLDEEIAVKMQNAKLEIENGRAKIFQPQVRGRKVNGENFMANLEEAIGRGQSQVKLAVDYFDPEVTLASLNNQGINELVARGESDFSGSPANRRHNISTGAARFDGLIIPAGQTFSFIKNLGDVSGATGYREELVIKGDETTPEYGGGLCQVSTTAFRAILNGGYPVVARQNHSYRVAYYEPAGTDATIYQPYPDLKFTNDSGGSILIDTYIIGNKLYFDFYSTKMEREVELDGPHIYNITEYPEPVYIETNQIAFGQTKQVDIAHRGADTILYRKIYENGELTQTDEFRSHYIPWPAKYLVGKVEGEDLDLNLGNIDESVDPTSGPVLPLDEAVISG